MILKVITIGVYGFTSEAFFHALAYAHTDLLCDLRARRGMRGPLYAFVNSERLQQSLVALRIRYLYIKALSPARPLREQQRQADKSQGVAKRTRVTLARTFIEEYERHNLAAFDAHNFIEQLGSDIGVIALFCVEQRPEACHRSLVAAKLAQDLGLEVEHILPASYTGE